MKNLLITLFITFSLTACMEKSDSPKQVAQKYWDALKAGDHATARKLVSKDSQQNFETYLAQPSEQKTAIDKITLGTEVATVTTVISPKDTTPDNSHTLETVLILENGQWKIDASQTQLPAPAITSEEELEKLAKQLSESMQENIDSMDDALTEGMEMLDEALREGSHEMGESLLKGMNEMNEALRESIDRMKERRLEDQSIDEDTGEGMI
jgi:hypothetical protein